ncbi:MAG: biopolymer transporter ExbD [Gemmatimonadetes bacterium]|nr:biopolymer transporter ExbD [Gemmatimonadota bacterium]
MIRQARLQRKARTASEIPSSSLADMAFLLLIFFMVSTTFRREQPRAVVLPAAQATEDVDEPRKNILHVWIEPDGAIYINDQAVAPAQVSEVVAPLYQASDRRLVVVLRGDRNVPYRVIDRVQRELQEAGARRVTFRTTPEGRQPPTR